MGKRSTRRSSAAGAAVRAGAMVRIARVQAPATFAELPRNFPGVVSPLHGGSCPGRTGEVDTFLRGGERVPLRPFLSRVEGYPFLWKSSQASRSIVSAR